MKRSLAGMARMAPRILAGAGLVLSLFLLVGCSSKTPEEKLNEAVQLVQQGQTARGVIKLRDVIREHPSDPAALDARMLLARYYVGEGNAQKALEYLEEVLEATPFEDQRHAEALQGVIEIRMQLRDFEKVIALLDQEAAKVPGAVPQIRESFEMEKTRPMLALGNDESTSEALAILDRIMLESDEPAMRGSAREQLADYHRSVGQFAESNAAYQRYLDRFPDDVIRDEIRLAMAMNRYNGGEKEEGLRDFEEAAVKYLERVDKELEQARKNSMLNGLAQMMASIQQHDKAEELYRRIMAENKLSKPAIDAQFQMAFMYIRAGIGLVDDDLFGKGAAILEQIARENAGTSYETNALNILGQGRQMMELAKNPPAPATDDSETTATVETPS